MIKFKNGKITIKNSYIDLELELIWILIFLPFVLLILPLLVPFVCIGILIFLIIDCLEKGDLDV